MLFLLDANRRPLRTGCEFAAEMLANGSIVVERNKFLSEKLDGQQRFGQEDDAQERCPRHED
jgi:hypothetical protein